MDGKILPGHVIKTEKVANEGSCRVKCFIEPNCVSINVGPADEHGGRTCELKNFTDESSSQSGLEKKEGHIHYAVDVCYLVDGNSFSGEETYCKQANSSWFNLNTTSPKRSNLHKAWDICLISTFIQVVIRNRLYKGRKELPFPPVRARVL